MPDPIPITCPEWEYESVPNFDLVLRSRAKSALDIIRKSQPSQLLTRIKDTRPVHQQFFRDLTPPTTPYYAGNYRGQNILCLKDYQVRIKMTPASAIIRASFSVIWRRSLLRLKVLCESATWFGQCLMLFSPQPKS